jgi:hypothetical protein
MSMPVNIHNSSPAQALAVVVDSGRE